MQTVLIMASYTTIEFARWFTLESFGDVAALGVANTP
jgi:hypothetical protein